MLTKNKQFSFILLWDSSQVLEVYWIKSVISLLHVLYLLKLHLFGALGAEFKTWIIAYDFCKVQTDISCYLIKLLTFIRNRG